MSTSAEKLVKQTIKFISRVHDLDYEELKVDAKKVIKSAGNYDDSLMSMMEEMMDLGNVGSQEELEDFNMEVLKIYCRIKEIESSGSDKSIRSRVWDNIEEEFELDDDESGTDEDETDEDETEEPEIVAVPLAKQEPEIVVKKHKRSKEKAEKEVVIIG